MTAPAGAVAVVPAAGRAQRFGSAKLLVLADGVPLLARTVTSLLDAGVDRVVVVTSSASHAAFAALPVMADPRVRLEVNLEPSRGMLSTVQVGCAAAEGSPVVVLPGDIPFVRAETIRLVVDAARRESRCVVPTYRGERGHPVGFPGAWRPPIVAAEADGDLSALLKRLDPRGQLALAVDDPGVLRDIDVPGDLRA